MIVRLRNWWKSFIGEGKPADPVGLLSVANPAEGAGSGLAHRPRRVAAPLVDIALDDPLVAYIASAPGVVEIDRLTLDSPALRALQAAGVKLAVPLVNQGELIGLLNLGPNLSQHDYSINDYRLLNHLATQAAPVLRVAQLVHQQQTETVARERLDQELSVARLIQQSLLPKRLPELRGWQVAVHYQPARAVGGDFYDFIYFADGQVGILIGDVTDKGVPAALVMATTRTLLRAVAPRLVEPGEVLERVNELLHDDIPPKMFVTCLYAVLDPSTGQLIYANAGHDLPYLRSAGGVGELRATGMPLGLLPGMRYEQKKMTIAPGESILFYSDGLVEAHSPQREMFSFARLRDLVGRHPTGGATLIDFLLDELARFAGPGWEQEDDVTLVTLQREPVSPVEPAAPADEWRLLTEFSVPSEPGNEREAMHRVTEAVQVLALPKASLERLKTAVAEATMNAIEHGNKNRPDLPVEIRLLVSDQALAVRITDQGGGQPIPVPAAPDLEAKLTGRQTPRGWGLFLIKNLMDEIRIISDEVHHTLELVLYL